MFQTQINRLLLAVIVFNLCFIVGCHRSYYRRQADMEAQRLIREKANDPRWNSADGTIEIDPQSRMFNPFSKDHPPIPPDDADSHQFMHVVDGKEGYPHWHANGDTDAVENPDWKAYLPVNDKGQVVLTLERAYQLALLHSPQFQQQRETLYRSALAVSLQRFGFDSQLFSGYNSFLTTQGRFRGGGTSQTTVQSQLGANGGGANLRRLGITGTNFAVGLANTILFNFAGNNTQSATSLIDFSLIQPLLRGAGRERIMESLTQAERTLLANVRQMERFKRGFYLNIAVGRNAGAGPNLAGNFLTNPGFGSANAGGFFGLLQQQQQIRNQEINVRQLQAVLSQFREFFARDRLDAVQLKLFESQFYSQQRGLLDQKIAYETALDSFKVQLGLPPDLEVIVDDPYLDRFELISDQINDRLIAIVKLREETGEVLNAINELFEGRREEGFQWPTDVNASVLELRPYVERAEETLKLIVEEDAPKLRADFDKLEAVRQQRIDYLKDLRKEVLTGRIISNVDRDLLEAESIPVADELREGLEGEPKGVTKSIMQRAQELQLSLDATQARISRFAEDENRLQEEELLTFIKEQFQQQIPGQLAELNNLTLEMSLLEAFARSNSIEITNVSIDDEHAIRVARCMRRDWMNARANLVDQWRNIEFVADQLEAGIDLVIEGDIGNVGDNPFKLRYETGQLRAGFRIDAPIVRLSERNQYRDALIAYQQSRRSFYQFEDVVKQNLRQLIRNVGRNKIRFELDRRSVQVSIENVEINRLELERPVGPNANSSRLGTTTAQNLSQAIIGLNGAQNSFLNSWVQYEVLRRNIDFDLGTMMLDEMGQWLDPGEIDSSIGVRAASMLGIEPDCQFCENIGTSYLPQLSEEELEALESKDTSKKGAAGFNILDLQKLRARGVDEDSFENLNRLDPADEIRRQELLNEFRRNNPGREQRIRDFEDRQRRRFLEQQQSPLPDPPGLINPATPLPDPPNTGTQGSPLPNPPSGPGSSGLYPSTTPISSRPVRSADQRNDAQIPIRSLPKIDGFIRPASPIAPSTRLPDQSVKEPISGRVLSAQTQTTSSTIQLTASTGEEATSEAIQTSATEALLSQVSEEPTVSQEPMVAEDQKSVLGFVENRLKPRNVKAGYSVLEPQSKMIAPNRVAIASAPPSVQSSTKPAFEPSLAPKPSGTVNRSNSTEPEVPASLRRQPRTDSNESFDWKQNESTLGGLLNRFK